MSAAAEASDPPTQPSRSASLLSLVHKLIDYGRELAATIRRRAFTDPTSVICCFGTADVALILARISRGLHRADALEARLIRCADRLDAAPPGCSVPAPAARTPATRRTRYRRDGPAPRSPAHPGADRRRGPSPADRRRHRRHLS
jgi:hypothetical protein